MDKEAVAVLEKEPSEKEISDKELNFSRLREKTKRLEAEAQESRRQAEELRQLREKDRLELEELKARQKELALQASLYEEDTEAPDEIIVSGKLKEKQKKLVERQAHVFRKEISDTKKEFEEKLRAQERENEERIKTALAEQEFLRLYATYGEDGISAELDAEEHLKTVLQLMKTPSEKAAYLSKHFEKKEKNKATLSQANRGNSDPINTGIGAGMSSGNSSNSGKVFINKASLKKPEELQSFNDSVMRSLGIGSTKPK